MEQKDCGGKEGLPGLWEKGSRRTCFCFCCASFTRREFGGLELRTNCVSTISFPPPLHSQLYGNKAQNRSGDLRLCISSGSWPVSVFCFCFFLGDSISLPHLKGDTFPSQIYVWMWVQCSNDFIFDLCFKALEWVFFFFNSFGGQGECVATYLWMDRPHSTWHPQLIQCWP